MCVADEAKVELPTILPSWRQIKKRARSAIRCAMRENNLCRVSNFNGEPLVERGVQGVISSMRP